MTTSLTSIIRKASIAEQIWGRFYSRRCERINEGGGGAAQASRPLLDMESGPFIGVGQLFHGWDGKKTWRRFLNCFLFVFKADVWASHALAQADLVKHRIYVVFVLTPFYFHLSPCD